MSQLPASNGAGEPARLGAGPLRAGEGLGQLGGLAAQRAGGPGGNTLSEDAGGRSSSGIVPVHVHRLGRPAPDLGAGWGCSARILLSTGSTLRSPGLSSRPRD